MDRTQAEYNKKVYAPKRVNRAIERYDELRKQLRELPLIEAKRFNDFRELLELQRFLVKAVVDLNNAEGLAQKIRNALRPLEADLERYHLYSFLAGERDTTTANYLYGRQK